MTCEATDRLNTLRAAYTRYRNMDVLIMDPLFLVGDKNCSAAYRHLIRALWAAVKAAAEKRQS